MSGLTCDEVQFGPLLTLVFDDLCKEMSRSNSLHFDRNMEGEKSASFIQEGV